MASKRGTSEQQKSVLSAFKHRGPDPVDPLIRRIRVVFDEAVDEMVGRFEQMYSTKGRPSVLPEVQSESTVSLPAREFGRGLKQTRSDTPPS